MPREHSRKVSHEAACNQTTEMPGADLQLDWQAASTSPTKQSESRAAPGQGKSEQRPHKVSYTVTVKGKEAAEVITALDRDLAAAGLSAKVIYSGGEDLDILPQQASKGKGLEFLLSQVGVHVPADELR